MQDFKREDYIYLRMIEDYEDKNGVKFKEGTILRYNKEWLIENIKGRQLGYVFDHNNELIFEKNDECDENDIFFDKIYKSITVPKNRSYKLCLWPGDYLYLNDWLYKHIDSRGIDAITNSQKKVIADKANGNNLIELGEGYPYKVTDARISFKKGETLDFWNPSVFFLFYNLDWIKLFAKTEVIKGKEKQELFDEDFSNAIRAQEPHTASHGEDDIDYDLREYHYFKMKEDIKVKTKDELKEKFGIEIPIDVNFICDDDGFIKWVYTETGYSETSYRDTEQVILKFSDRISVDEAHECHKRLVVSYRKQQEELQREWKNKCEKENEKLQKLYDAKKNDPSYFPGTNGCFVHNDSKNMEKEKYTLSQVKEFYQKLKTLSPDIVKEMCFYGGTIPYVLNNASESRDFGDIDIFYPVSKMEELREELEKQDSFEMICDSKPLAEFCNLTSRIQKDSTELVDETENAFQFLSLMANAIDESQRGITDVNCKGSAHNSLEEFFDKSKPYYNKIQDFGFKAKLFGINISVFPIYQYKDDIMAKSFNINEMNKFLLGVRVLNNKSIDNFVKNVKLYDSSFKVLPLEYTLVSKKSAVDEQYSSRLEKDRADIEYILSHKKELGLSDKKIQEILSKYPDFSISIAYRVNDNGTTSTMDGDTYKKLVLTNRNIS